ncbi:MAG TPA: deoxyribonuclease V [Thermomicrobiales bacterium]|nr:deoxyribonuclease V [Thermomicrobiales bacterium]
MAVHEAPRWDVTPAEARQIQEALRDRVSLQDAASLDAIQLVAGIDNTYVKHEGKTTAYAVIVLFTFPDLVQVETVYAERVVTFPYVPGLLSFREIPTILDAWERLEIHPDLVLCDGHGYAHPRRLGLATHLGIVLDRPTIGCAKSRLVGTWDEPERTFGAYTPLMIGDEHVGAAVRTRPRHKPLFVSPGHMISITTAIRLTLACCRGGFMPVPTTTAHDLVTAYARPHRI